MISRLKKLVNLISIFWITSLDAELEYRFNMFIESVSVIGNLIGSVFILSLFYGPDTNLGGWEWSASLVVLGVYTFLDGITSTFLQPNLSRIVRHVQNGTLCLFWIPSSLILSVLDTELGHFTSRRPAPAGGSPGDIRGIPGTPYPQDYDREFTPADLPPE